MVDKHKTQQQPQQQQPTLFIFILNGEVQQRHNNSALNRLRVLAKNFKNTTFIKTLFGIAITLY